MWEPQSMPQFRSAAVPQCRSAAVTSRVFHGGSNTICTGRQQVYRYVGRPPQPSWLKNGTSWRRDRACRRGGGSTRATAQK